MRRICLASIVALAFIPCAYGGEPKTAPPPLSARAFALSLQQTSAAAQLMLEDVDRQISAMRARISELEKLCGDPCKPPALESAPAPASK